MSVSQRKKLCFVVSSNKVSSIMLLLGAALGGCDKFSQNAARDQRAGLIEGVGKAKVVSASIDPSSGVISAKMAANSPYTQELRAESSGSLKGTVLSFPPGALTIDTEISLEEAVPLANASLGASLGIDGSLTKSSAALAVLPQTTTDPAQPFTVAIILSDSAALQLLADNLVIVYKVKIYAEDKIVVGVIPTSAITIEGNTVKFAAKYFGAFQAAYSSVPVTEEKKVEVTTPIQAKREVASLAPMTITGRSTFIVRSGSTVQLTGTNFRPTMTLALGTTPIKDTKFLSDTSASFTIPTTSSNGVMSLTADQDGTSQSVALFYSSAPLSYPVSTLSASEICTGVVYYDGNGKQTTGTKPCVVDACTASKTTDCVANTTFPAVDQASLPLDKIRTGTSIAGREGTLGSCAEGGDGCVVVSPYKAANTSNLAGKILSGYSIAGIQGTAIVEAHTNCSTEGSLGCITTSSYPPVSTTGLADKILSTSTVAGVAGNVTLPAESDVRLSVQYGVGGISLTGAMSSGSGPGSCNASTTTNCVASTAFPAIELSQIPIAEIRTSASIAGVAGTLPDCNADGDQTCYVGGSRKAIDPANIQPWNLRRGVSLVGVTGALYTNCRNGVPLPVSVPTAYDTVDDLNAGDNSNILTTSPWSPSDSYLCGGFDASGTSTTSVWVVGSSADCVGTATDIATCHYRDKISNLLWSKDYGSAQSWNDAKTTCDGLTGGWRIPTQKELLDAYNHGVRSTAGNNGWITLTTLDNGDFWSASSNSGTPGSAWAVHLSKGEVVSTDKVNSTHNVICVKDAS